MAVTIIREINKTLKILEKLNAHLLKLKNEYKQISRGSKCSLSGRLYEEKVYNIVSNCKIKGKTINFNTQDICSLGGNSARNDLECNWLEEGDIGIEIKKKTTPDWMQCTIKYNKETKKWEISERHRIPIKSVQIFKRILNRYNKKKLIFKGKIPPFINRQITHSKWLEIKICNCPV